MSNTSEKVDTTPTDSAAPPRLDQPAAAGRAKVDAELSSGVSRRRFLEAAGFTISIAAVNGCRRAPPQTALPLPDQSAGQIPGRNRNYASTCAGCSAGCGLSVVTRDGRPLKMEGLPDHPVSAGGLCAVGQASPLALYDSYRLPGPLKAGQPADWTVVDEEISAGLQKVKDDKSAVRLVTSTVTSPTLQAKIDEFLEQFEDGRGQHVMLDAVSSSAILDAHKRTHGVRVLPRFRFDRARVIVSFGADFLGTWISPVEFAAGWRQQRVPSEADPEMSYHVQLESRMSLTGSNADRRFRIRPQDQGPLLARLAEVLADDKLPLAPAADDIIPDQQAVLQNIADRLQEAKGESLVVSDSQDVGVQVLVNYINDLLGNYFNPALGDNGKTLDIQRPSRQRMGDDAKVAKLIKELKSDEIKIGALLVAGTDLSHNLPDRESFAAAVGKVPLVVSLAEREDDFSSLAGYVCPDHHALESWLDAEPIHGEISLTQPVIHPLGKTRSMLESLERWSGPGRNATAYEILRDFWRTKMHAQRRRDDAPGDFPEFWDQAVRDGFVSVKPVDVGATAFQQDAVKPLDANDPNDGMSLVLYTNVAMPDSRHAHNPWLHELPDPVTKVTWTNYVSISPDSPKAIEEGLTDGDVVRVTYPGVEPPLELKLPVLLQRGQHDDVLAIALAYGVIGTDRRFRDVGPEWFEAPPPAADGEFVGENAAVFLQFQHGALRYVRDGVTLEPTGERVELAATQEHHSLEVPHDVAPRGAEVRDAVQQTTLGEYTNDSHAGASEHHHSAVQLWPEDHPKQGHHWGMVVDLNACSGCSACVIACQAENNVPVVGRDEVLRQREMHWMRIDRYYAGEDDDVEVSHQPMMCQHCDNAPCETVCPVLATVHSHEGLNEQVYNRCVGTRYCANNCPYKVRRFNWFEYLQDDPQQRLQNLALNPDVTVRSRGVMEKCSMCVQRIESGRIDARSQGGAIKDGDVQTACQQSCPAQAIVFGDMNDPESRIHEALQDPRRYAVLEELNVRPSVSYLRVVKNREEKVAAGGEDNDAGAHEHG